jgi:hypothetical protein
MNKSDADQLLCSDWITGWINGGSIYGEVKYLPLAQSVKTVN